MGKLSRQERIGAMVLAAIALLIAGGAFLLRSCASAASDPGAPQVRVIHSPEDADNSGLQDPDEDRNDTEIVHDENHDGSGLSKAGKHRRSRKDSRKRNPHKKKASKKPKNRRNSGQTQPQADRRNLYDPFEPVPTNTSHKPEKDYQNEQ